MGVGRDRTVEEGREEEGGTEGRTWEEKRGVESER